MYTLHATYPHENAMAYHMYCLRLSVIVYIGAPLVNVGSLVLPGGNPLTGESQLRYLNL